MFVTYKPYCMFIDRFRQARTQEFRKKRNDLQEGPPVRKALPKTAPMLYATEFLVLLACTLQPKILMSEGDGVERA